MMNFQTPSPELGDTVYCRMCQDYKSVASVEDRVTLLCSITECSAMPVSYSDEEMARAMRRAFQHVGQHHLHLMRIYHGNRYVGTVGWETDKERRQTVPKVTVTEP